MLSACQGIIDLDGYPKTRAEKLLVEYPGTMIYIQATVDVILSNTEIEKEPLSSGGKGGL